MVDIQPATKVELHISCEGLLNKDTFSKSDPYCIVLIQNRVTQKLHEIERTEVVKNNLSPVWCKGIILDFHFEVKQVLWFKVRDLDESGKSHLGKAMSTLGDIVSLGSITLNLTKQGKITIKAEEVSNTNNALEFHIRGSNLDNKGMCCFKNDPFLVLYKNIDGKWVQSCKTNVCKNTLNPRWEVLRTTSQKLCNNDQSRPIRIECFDKKLIGQAKLIGSEEQTLENLLKKSFDFQIFESNETKALAKSSGTLRVDEVQSRPILSFIDYLRAGVKLSCAIAIDFTASNGLPSNPQSLHYSKADFKNQYEKAIIEIGGILESYDSDKNFAVYGFGGIVAGSLSHAFSLTESMENPYVNGVSGVLDRYHQALQKVRLSGPTHFHQIIDGYCNTFKSSDPKQQYNILLILTDGAIMDMPETIASIINASRRPLSIIIVGVGNADFTSMNVLDCDSGSLVAGNGVKSARDIVQFVPFNKFSGDAIALAAEVLREVPKQLTSFMEMIKFSPAVHHEHAPSILSGAVHPIQDTPHEVQT